MRWVAALALCLCFVTSARAQGDWGVTRSGFDANVVRRYKAILARAPHDAAALRQLVAIYRRYKSVATLAAEYEAEGETWSALCVRAHMPGVSRDVAVGYLQRALKLRPDDGQGWMAVGELTQDSKVARDAFRAALAHVTSVTDRTRALDGLLGAARVLHDAPAIDAAYAELIAMRPRDGRLWLDRGDAQLAAGKAADAVVSFGEAEKRLRGDPEKRLAAMTAIGVALERQGKVDEAVAQWEATLDAVPRGYYLGGEVVAHIIDVERTRKRLREVAVRLEERWPERRRGYLEWSTLAALYDELGDSEHALGAYRAAVAKAPTEIGTQRKLIALLDKLGRTADALAQHEKAARLAPGDADLQLELARRYGDGQRDKAIAVLVKLAKRLPSNVNVRASIAKLYDEWEDLPRAIGEYEAVANLEPNEIDHAVILGDAYWRAHDVENARLAWARLAKIGTFAALQRQGEVLSDHDQWELAIDAFTAAIAANPTSADPLRGRARARDALGRYSLAADDARRAVALIGLATEADGLRERALLVRVLGHARLDDVTRWRFAFEHGDNAAGYLLAAHYTRIDSADGDDILVELSRRVPEDETLGIAVARTYAHQGKWDRAKQELERIGKRSPKRADDIAALIEQIDRDHKNEELAARLAEEGRQRDLARTDRRDTDLVGRDNRVGFRLFLGSDVRNTTSAIAGYGIYRYSRIAPATALAMRLEYWERDDRTEERHAFAFGTGFVHRVLDLRKLEVAAGLGARVEVRYAGAGEDSAWERFGLGADATLELLPRGVPTTIDVRWTQNLTDSTNGSTLLFELGFEVR